MPGRHLFNEGLYLRDWFHRSEDITKRPFSRIVALSVYNRYPLATEPRGYCDIFEFLLNSVRNNSKQSPKSTQLCL